MRTKRNRVLLWAFFLTVFALSGQTPEEPRRDALKLYNAGRFGEAIEVCEKELWADPNNRDSYVVLCWSLVSNRQYAEAELRASHAWNLNRYDQRIIEILAEAKYFLGKNAEALALFEEYITLVPVTTGARINAAYYYMGEIYIRMERFQHAEIAMTTAVRFEPNRDDWWMRLGYAREMAGNHSEAVSAYDQALRLNPASTDAQRGRLRAMSNIR
ncbi:MAG: tetratricopeptide repeat protein [Spirochaetaceae bacterium]|jgi:tetratricopeptide (TPR) repeat protein|nr:tetratricopeptide repeat protein [Spirochaetaceae bacterium]